MTLRLRSRLVAFVMIMVMLFSVTGCLYPEDQSPQRDASAREAVLTVQDAVDRYKEQTGLLPIQNAGPEIPEYEKYKLDFGKLKRMGFLANIPPAAYESGGDYQFLIIDEETKPLVKLIDLNVFQAVASVQRKVDEYLIDRQLRNITGSEAYAGFAYIDFGKLGIKDPEVRSMYSRQPLSLLIDGQGRVYVDYGIDIATALQKSGTAPDGMEDLRRSLVEASYYVPVRAPIYHWLDGEPRAIPLES